MTTLTEATITYVCDACGATELFEAFEDGTISVEGWAVLTQPDGVSIDLCEQCAAQVAGIVEGMAPR